MQIFRERYVGSPSGPIYKKSFPSAQSAKLHFTTSIWRVTVDLYLKILATFQQASLGKQKQLSPFSQTDVLRQQHGRHYDKYTKGSVSDVYIPPASKGRKIDNKKSPTRLVFDLTNRLTFSSAPSCTALSHSSDKKKLFHRPCSRERINRCHQYRTGD